VLDGAVCVLDLNQGVEPQTETVWRQGDNSQRCRASSSATRWTRLADFYQCLKDIVDRLGAADRHPARLAPSSSSRASSTWCA
jgi:elongation factor G